MTTRTCRVLVADGDADVRSVVEDLLIDRGFEVRQAANADEAANRLLEDGFDVLLCHLTLLRADPGRLREQLRELQPAPRVVAMSASGAEARSEEADATLPKPFTRAQLLAALRPH